MTRGARLDRETGVSASAQAVSCLARQHRWSEFLSDVTLFENAVRLRFLIWTLQRYVSRGDQVLEVGCGSGTMAVLMADLGIRVTACDIDAELVRRLGSKYSAWICEGQLAIQTADMFCLPWAEKHFDLVYHQGVLEHFPDDRIVAALREQARVAHLVAFDVPNNRDTTQPFGDERLLTVQHWRKLIRAAGLDVIEERGRDFHRSLYWLPYALFSRRALERMPWFGRRYAVNSIFVCRSPR